MNIELWLLDFSLGIIRCPIQKVINTVRQNEKYL